MTLSATAKLRLREILTAAFYVHEGRCHVCHEAINRDSAGNLAWIPVDGGDDPNIKYLFTHATAAKFAAALERCRPVHRACKEPVARPVETPAPPKRPTLTLRL
ncbi:hypothetical protein KZX46_21465 (plasmid) [Polymorphobacter sp. PAMC 29334]|uniref:hypothetical protein n=1 Tax=Polymorphobacter sp. PAMC 29334 TaxID=2862331 RepID=UPI001C7855AC|nr:hypothetical protein [Polymorphobacter sp. PAMC 29334]QYE37207.1 hypothetical protein KZX46_21465 [Polymorphobacter sp. PAMC 29334]